MLAFTPEERAMVNAACADLTVLTAKCERRYTLFKALATLLKYCDDSAMVSLNSSFSNDEVR